MKPLEAWGRMPDCPGKVAIIKQVNLSNAQSVQITHFDVFMCEVAKQAAKKAPPAMFYHEAIFADKPCHLFMDCEKDLACVNGVWETVDRDAFIQNVHEQVVQVVARCASITTAPTYPLILDSTREDKFSLHLLWNTSADTPRHLRALIQDIEAPFGVTIDEGPCSATGSTPKSLRMPWCGKRSPKDFREAMYVLRPAAPWDTFTPESFCKHLISIYADKSEKWAHALSPVPTELYTHPNGSGKKRLASSVCEGYMEAGEDFTSPIFDWFQMYNPTFTPVPEVCPNGGYRSRAQVYCPVAGRWHKSNGGMVSVDAFGFGRVICFDPCCSVPWSLPYSDAHLRATQEPVQIDWDIMALIRK